MLTPAELAQEAAAAGFPVASLEKAQRLLRLLETLRGHPFLKERIALKGGTALNLFVFDVPRLSVDVDLNYIGSADRDTMLTERPQVDQAIQAVAERLGHQVHRVPEEHAGGKWRLSYADADGRSKALELDLNFLHRVPLWPVGIVDSRPVGSVSATAIPVLDVHELAAGKLAALFARKASRDLFDARSLLREARLDRDRLRLGFVVYGGASPRDWRTVSIEDLRADPTEVERQLLPVLRGNLVPAPSDVAAWSQRLVVECRDLLGALLPLEAHEREFLTRLNDRGEIAPELLTADAVLQAKIAASPALQWKALKVRGRG
jgi:hypothetical protein